MRSCSWLQEFVAVRPSTPRPIGDAFDDLGTPVEEVTRLGEGLDGIVVARVLDPAPAPQRRQDPAGRRRRRRRRAAPDLLRRVQHGRRRPRAAGHAGHGDARRHGDRAAQAAGRVVQRDALLVAASSAWATTTTASASSPADLAPGHAARRRPRHRARRAVGPRGQPQPARRHVGRRRGPRPGRPRSASPLRACPTPGRDADRRRRRGRRRVTRRDRRPRPVRAVRAPGCCAASIRSAPRPAWMQQRLTHLGMRPDQRPGRHLQLRDARARPAQPPLRPGQGARRRASGSGGPATARRSSPSTTSSARFTADDLLICDGDDRPVGIAGVMGGADCEICADHHRRRCWRWPGSSPWSIGRTLAPARPAHRGVGPLREGLRPRGHRPGRGPVLPAGRRDLRRHRSRPAWSTCAASCPTATAGPGPHRPGQRAARHRPRAAAASRALLEPIGFAVHAAPATTTTTSPSRRGATTPRPRSTSSRRSPATTATRNIPRRELTDAARRPAHAASSSERRAVRRLLRRPRPGRGACRCRSSPRATSAAAGLAADGHRAAQPAGRRGVGAAHRRCCPGLVAGRRLQRRPPPAPACGCSRSATSSCRRRTASCCPTSASTSAWSSPAREAPAAVEVWQVAGRPARRRSTPAVANADAARPAPDPRRRGRWSTATSVGVGRRDRPRRARPPRHRRAGRLARGRPRRAARRPRRDRRLPAGQPVPVERHRPGLRGARRRSSAVDVERTLAAGRRRWSGRSACSTSTGATGSGRRPSEPGLPPCASRPPTAPSPTPRWPRPAAALIDAGRVGPRRHPPRLSPRRHGRDCPRRSRLHSHARGRIGSLTMQ